MCSIADVVHPALADPDAPPPLFLPLLHLHLPPPLPQHAATPTGMTLILAGLPLSPKLALIVAVNVVVFDAVAGAVFPGCRLGRHIRPNLSPSGVVFVCLWFQVAEIVGRETLFFMKGPGELE